MRGAAFGHTVVLGEPDPAGAVRALAPDGVDRIVEVDFAGFRSLAVSPRASAASPQLQVEQVQSGLERLISGWENRRSPSSRSLWRTTRSTPTTGTASSSPFRTKSSPRARPGRPAVTENMPGE